MPEIVLPEIGEPERSVGVHRHVVRHGTGPREIVFGHDRMRGLALGTRQRLKWILRVPPGGLGNRPVLVLYGRPAHSRAAAARLHLWALRTRRCRVAAHAQENRGPLLGRVVRPDDGLERMTKASAAERRSLLRRGAGPARDPLTVGQLSRHVLNLVKLQIQLPRFWRGNLDNFYRARVVHFVANGPDAN